MCNKANMCFSFSQIHFQNSQPFADLLTVRAGNLQLIVLQRVRRRLREFSSKTRETFETLARSLQFSHRSFHASSTFSHVPRRCAPALVASAAVP